MFAAYFLQKWKTANDIYITISSEVELSVTDIEQTCQSILPPLRALLHCKGVSAQTLK